MHRNSDARKSVIADAKNAVLMLIQNKMQYCPKDEVGLVLLGTKGTKNELATERGDYKHITVQQPLTVPDMTLFRSASNIASEGYHGDLLDGIIVGTNMIHARTAGKKYAKRMFVITDAGNQVKNREDLKVVLPAVQREGISLFVIGIDFGPDEKADEQDDWSKLSVKRSNELVLYFLSKMCNGLVIPVSSALQILSTLRSKSVLQRTCFRENLYIADSMAIPLWGFVKTMRSSFPSLKRCSVRARQAGEVEDDGVKLERRYFLLDDPDQEVDLEKKIKAYRYGRSLVPFSTVDEEAMRFQSQRSMKLIGFAESSKVPRKYFMGTTYVFCTPPGSTAASTAFSALLHGMYETNKWAIVRYVRCKNSPPVVGVLVPCIKPGREFAFFHALPFAEDIRTFPFREMSHVKHTKEQLDAVGDLITAMDLEHADRSDGSKEGGSEALKPKSLFNPCIQHFYQCVRQRALNKDTAIPRLDPAIASYTLAWEEKGVLRHMLDNASKSLARVRDLFPLTAVTEAARERKPYWFSTDVADISLESYAKPVDGVPAKPIMLPDVDSGVPAAKRLKGDGIPGGRGYLASDPRSLNSSSLEGGAGLTLPEKLSLDGVLSSRASHVGTVNPVKDFNEMFSRRDEDLVDRAISEMQNVIKQLLQESIGDQYYEKAAACLVALRAGCLREEEADQFNRFLRHLKHLHSTGRRADWWARSVKAQGISLICQEDGADVDVSAAEARSFLEGVDAPAAEPMLERKDSAEEDLFGELE
eukprot:TRINITY_DN30931_c0_g1_i1.p1 TRINITY_DN30931_c0_g1~~TRINITY_DN30931_c0_g1_i1.p1  ORF type:complete len:790 (+),score=120.93 TRINITY_DN30931_c0_g1_i1:94-2370(+)